jgi:nucleotide-binding universal stress UspA family protein
MDNQAAMKRIVVGVDGSEHADAAIDWAITMAQLSKSEIIAVFAIPPPSYVEYGAGYAVPVLPPELDPEWRAAMRHEFEHDWCKSLRDSGLPYRTIVEDGRAASVIAAVADRENGDLVVVGRRGRGGLAELLLGSVSNELSHHCRRPVVLISSSGATAPKEPASRTAAQA